MERIETLLAKIKALNQNEDLHPIDVELMIDYTKLLYAELQELKTGKGYTSSHHKMPTSLTVIVENNLGDIAQPIDLSTEDTSEEATQVVNETKEPVFTRIPYEDIRKSIGFNDKFQFISELFSNNKEAYERVMDKINTCNDVEEALRWIEQEIVPVFQWQDEDEAVQYFYTTVLEYFMGR